MASTHSFVCYFNKSHEINKLRQYFNSKSSKATQELKESNLRRLINNIFHQDIKSKVLGLWEQTCLKWSTNAARNESGKELNKEFCTVINYILDNAKEHNFIVHVLTYSRSCLGWCFFERNCWVTFKLLKCSRSPKQASCFSLLWKAFCMIRYSGTVSIKLLPIKCY